MPLDALVHRRRPAGGEPQGAMVLMHGRGVDENDLIPLFDLLDPERRLEAFTPRAPLTPPARTGFHWYVIERVGFPHAETFRQSYGLLDAWLSALADETGIPPERTILGGFSQGAVMAYALGLGTGRPVPAGIVGLSGFVPIVTGWEPDFEGRDRLPVYLAHGTNDIVIPVALARRSHEMLEGNVALTYRETHGGHGIEAETLAELRSWLPGVFERQPSG